MSSNGQLQTYSATLSPLQKPLHQQDTTDVTAFLRTPLVTSDSVAQRNSRVWDGSSTAFQYSASSLCATVNSEARSVSTVPCQTPTWTRTNDSAPQHQTPNVVPTTQGLASYRQLRLSTPSPVLDTSPTAAPTASNNTWHSSHLTDANQGATHPPSSTQYSDADTHNGATPVQDGCETDWPESPAESAPWVSILNQNPNADQNLEPRQLYTMTDQTSFRNVSSVAPAPQSKYGYLHGPYVPQSEALRISSVASPICGFLFSHNPPIQCGALLPNASRLRTHVHKAHGLVVQAAGNDGVRTMSIQDIEEARTCLAAYYRPGGAFDLTRFAGGKDGSRQGARERFWREHREHAPGDYGRAKNSDSAGADIGTSKAAETPVAAQYVFPSLKLAPSTPKSQTQNQLSAQCQHSHQPPFQSTVQTSASSESDSRRLSTTYPHWDPCVPGPASSWMAPRIRTSPPVGTAIETKSRTTLPTPSSDTNPSPNTSTPTLTSTSNTTDAQARRRNKLEHRRRLRHELLVKEREILALELEELGHSEEESICKSESAGSLSEDVDRSTAPRLSSVTVKMQRWTAGTWGQPIKIE